MIVLSSATTGALSRNAWDTSSVRTRAGFRVVTGVSSAGCDQRGLDESRGEIGADRVRAGEREHGGGLAVAGRLDRVAAIEHRVAEGGEHRVASTSHVL